MYDITIVGSGPAGATLARLLGNKYNVLLLEKRTFMEGMPLASEKSCGGLLDPDAQQMMARFSLGIPNISLGESWNEGKHGRLARHELSSCLKRMYIQ